MGITKNAKAFAVSGVLSSLFGVVAPLGADRVAKAFIDNISTTGAIGPSLLATSIIGVVGFTLSNVFVVSAVDRHYDAFKSTVFGGIAGFAAGAALSLSVSSTDPNKIDVSTSLNHQGHAPAQNFRTPFFYPPHQASRRTLI